VLRSEDPRDLAGRGADGLARLDQDGEAPGRWVPAHHHQVIAYLAVRVTYLRDTQVHIESRGLDVRVVAAQRDRRKIDLVSEPAWDCPAEARIGELRAVVAGGLRQCGFTDISAVVRLGAQLAAQFGLSDARVTGDANYVEIGLTDTPDSMRDILAVLARVGIGPGLVLAVGGKPGPPDAADGSGSLLRVRQAAAVSGADHPAGALADISLAGGGLQAVLCLLEEQLRRAGCAGSPRWMRTQRGLCG